MGIGKRNLPGGHVRRLRGRAILIGALAAGAALVLTPAALASGRVPLGWLHTDSYANQASEPAEFWPGNLLDGRNGSAWCVDGGPESARGKRVRVAFKGKVEIDRVVVRTGRAHPPAAFAESNRVTRLIIDDGNYRRTLNLEDERGAQAVQLSPPVSANAFDIIIDAVAGEAERSCISGVVLFEGDKALNGRWMAANLRYDAGRSPLQGVWALGPAGSPERFLSLYLDGTFRYVYRPFDPSEEGFDRSGPFRYTEERLRLQIEGTWMSARAVRVSGRDELGEPFTHLQISDAHEELTDLQGDWTPWRR